jgi:hypothetical protein
MKYLRQSLCRLAYKPLLDTSNSTSDPSGALSASAKAAATPPRSSIPAKRRVRSDPWGAFAASASAVALELTYSRQRPGEVCTDPPDGGEVLSSVRAYGAEAQPKAA